MQLAEYRSHRLLSSSGPGRHCRTVLTSISPAVGQLADGLASFCVEAAGQAVAGGDIAGVAEVGDVQRQTPIVSGVGAQRVQHGRGSNLERVGVIAPGRADIADAAAELQARERPGLKR